MTRERLSEEEIGRISRSTPIPETLAVVEDILTARVTAARLAAVASENEAAQSDVWAASVNTDKGASWVKGPNDVAVAIRSRLTAPQVSALERVKAEARALGNVEGKLESAYAVARAVQAEAEAKRLRVALECIRDRKDVVPLGIRTFVVDALSAPAVPDGAAKGDGE